MLRTTSLAGLALVTLGALSADEASPKKPGSEFTIAPHTWPMFGGTPDRNMVNNLDKGIPAEFDAEKGKNILWFAELGSQSYGNPVISGGKAFVGTNNGNPRDEAIKGDKGNLMCFRATDGRFLWQIVHDKLPAGRVNDWPEQGVCSSPLIEGDKVYYVSNRGEVICATTEGLGAGNRASKTKPTKVSNMAISSGDST
ncbi:MAG: PQQ-binding-like beta-propeller repeat protein [Gemmatales bacterium]